MPRKSLVSAEAAALAICQYQCKLLLSRQQIARGNYRADMRLTGTCAGYDIDVVFAGEGVQSGPVTTASSTGPNKEEIAAWCRARFGISETRWEEAWDEAIAYYSKHAEMPFVTDESVAAEKPHLKQCRASDSVTKQGPFTFAADPDPHDLAAAVERAAA